MKNKIKAFFIILWQGIIKPLLLFVFIMIPLLALFILGCNNVAIVNAIFVFLGLLIIIIGIIIGIYKFIKYIHNVLIPAYYGALNWLKDKDKEKSNNEE